MKKRMITLKRILFLSCMCIVLTGCSKGKIEETEAITETEFVEQTETEAETEKTVGLKDIQSSVLRSGRKGSVDFSILSTETETEFSYSFESSQDGFRVYQDEDLVYSDKNLSAYKTTTGWMEHNAPFMNIWELLYSNDCKLEEMLTINGIPCYHVSITNEDESGSISGLCCYAGYTDVVTGTAKYDFYISSENFSIVRLDVTMPFLGMLEGKDQKAELTAVFQTESVTDCVFTPPEIISNETDTEKSTDYLSGDIVGDKNVYQNNTFGIQIVGSEYFTYDAQQTAAIQESYDAAGSNYKQEAYGKGENLIVSISSTPLYEKNTETCLSEYLSNSGATEIATAGTFQIGSQTCICSTATINQSKTKTFCLLQDQIVLFITVYYKTPESLSSFETCLYSIEEDPFWQEDFWVLQNKYEFATPTGYSIVETESTNLYARMKSGNMQVNIFAIEGGAFENEIKNESESTDSITRSVVSQEEIQLNTGETLACYMIQNSESEYNYYTYIGLLKKDTAVIKFYMVNTAEIADYTKIYKDFAERVSIVTEPQTELVLESETNN